MKHIFIIGSRGLPVGYSGYETFILKLTEYSKNMTDIKYHIACRGEGKNGSEYNNASRFYIKTMNIGNAKAIPYDIFAFLYSLKEVKENNYENAWIYILACRIGPFMAPLVAKAHSLGINVAVNPDGHEWMRGKWNQFIKKYWKYSEKLMVKHSDLMICDSIEMKRYINEEYKEFKPSTTYLSYGADSIIDYCSADKISQWYSKNDIRPYEYYLIVGRFIPENNYDIIINEFMKSKSPKDLVIITDIQENSFLTKLKDETNYESDKRIKFVGTVFDRPLINTIRKQAFLYFHGHEVGGTNPSLLEAMACGCVICALDVGFSREVLGESGIYFSKEEGNLSGIIDNILENNSFDELRTANQQTARIKYDWKKIATSYRQLWNSR